MIGQNILYFFYKILFLVFITKNNLYLRIHILFKLLYFIVKTIKKYENKKVLS